MGEQRKPGQGRSTDKWLPKLLILSVFVNLVVVPATGLTMAGVVGNSASLDDVEQAARAARGAALVAKRTAKQTLRESVQRIDATCHLFERQQREAQRRVARTREFLSGEQARLNPGLVAVARAQLPESVKEAREAQAPRYCDRPGVGLPE